MCNDVQNGTELSIRPKLDESTETLLCVVGVVLHRNWTIISARL